jgi:hypothetical protein
MVKDSNQFPGADYLWMEKVYRYIAYGKRGRAVALKKGEAK